MTTRSVSEMTDDELMIAIMGKEEHQIFVNNLDAYHRAKESIFTADAMEKAKADKDKADLIYDSTDRNPEDIKFIADRHAQAAQSTKIYLLGEYLMLTQNLVKKCIAEARKSNDIDIARKLYAAGRDDKEIADFQKEVARQISLNTADKLRVEHMAKNPTSQVNEYEVYRATLVRAEETIKKSSEENKDYLDIIATLN